MTILHDAGVMLMLLWAAHSLCDYALQSDFVAKGKNPTVPIPGVPWYQVMFAHCLMHAGAVLMITGSLSLGIVELVLHFGIDCAKCAGLFGSPLAKPRRLDQATIDRLTPNMLRLVGRSSDRPFNIDQALHYGLKLVYVFLLWKASHA